MDNAIKSATMASDVFDKLKKDLICGEFPSGEKLCILTLKETYGIGSSPLREALNRLAAYGFLEQLNHRGFRVPKLSLCELNDITELRMEMESMALERSFSNIDSNWEAELIAVHHKLQSLENDSFSPSEPWETVHGNFHKILFSACGSPWLLQFINQLHDQFDRYRRVYSIDNHIRKELNSHHQELLALALGKDIKSLLVLNREHVFLSFKSIESGFMK